MAAIIEVEVNGPRGTDRAEADTAEDALFAARTLWDEAFDGTSMSARSTTWRILVDGEPKLMGSRRP